MATSAFPNGILFRFVIITAILSFRLPHFSLYFLRLACTRNNI